VIRPVIALGLLLRFIGQVLLSGFDTAWQILRPDKRPVPAYIRMSYGPMSPRGAAVLGSLITLTPGTTTLDIDPVRRELLLHMLDGADPQTAVAGIRRHFEAPLLRLFPERDHA
jgi:multicomponent K+:H+ antiporter subunit E/multicomponent Na+:H+ antiporter subunit E